jgi:ABC-type polysaccharide/polyol phosphate transport system ATPase subunit
VSVNAELESFADFSETEKYLDEKIKNIILGMKLN